MDARIARAMRIIEQEMGEEIDYSAVAKQIGVSLYRFRHLFVAATGETPGGFLRRIRLDAAALRLSWTGETVGAIAHGLGYRSQAAFTRAFQDRFGTPPARFRREFERRTSRPPDKTVGRSVVLREVDGFRVLSKRYIGDLYEVRSMWHDFMSSLPEGVVRSPALYLGLVHDDPRLTPSHQQRYDCCITIDEDSLKVSVKELAARGLAFSDTRPGLYACQRHEGSHTLVAGSYSLLCDQWLPRSRYSPTEDPAIELHAVPRCEMPPEELRLTILLPLH